MTKTVTNSYKVVGPPETTPDTARQHAAPAQVVLLVGDIERAASVPAIRKIAGIAFAAFDRIDARTLEDINPDVIISPLFARSFDCIELAMTLEKLNYRGAYRAVATALPSPDLIRREIRELCPRLHFDVTFIEDAA